MERKDYRLAAILYTDIAGFSKMMEKNEARTLELLHKHNELIEGIVAKKKGTVIKTIGDAFLIDFKNTVDALQCAIDIQYGLYEFNKQNPDLPLLVRIGLHMGDIYFYENDALGEGINIASRLQSAAHPGCICMSQDVYNMVLNKVDFTAEKLGRVSLKNITKEIHAFEITTPNVEFDPNWTARPMLRPDKEEKLAPPPEAPDPSQADIKRRIMLDIKAAGRRLEVDQMLVRYGAEGKVAEKVIMELAGKGILLDSHMETGTGSGGGAGSGAGGGTSGRDGIVNAVTDLEYRIEDEIKRGLDAAFSGRRGALKASLRETVRETRDAARSARHEWRGEWRHERMNGSAEDGKWEGKVGKSYLRSAADSIAEYDDYAVKVRNEARMSKAGFVGHLTAFVAVNGFLMFLNASVSPGFPWALFPFGGWGIGLLEHFASVLRRGERAKELARLPRLEAKALELFKKLQKRKDSIFLHFASTASTTVFLAAINALVSPQFWWFAIPAVGMGIGFLSHAANFAVKKAELQGGILEALGRKGSWESALHGMPSSAAPAKDEYGPYAALVEEARATRAAILEQQAPAENADSKKKKKAATTEGSPVGDDFLPVLDSYVEQIGLLAKRTTEVDRIIDMIPMDSLKSDKERLERKIADKPGESLLKEYRKSLGEIERQESSFSELREQREVLELRMRSSVNTLKQMRIDLARLKGMGDQGDTASSRAVQEKTAELNRYLADLRAGYEELDALEERVLPPEAAIPRLEPRTASKTTSAIDAN